MQVTRHNDANQFQRDALPWLLRREAENNLIIGRVAALAREPLPADVLLITITDGRELVGAAMMTPPNPLVLTDAPDGAIKELAAWVREKSLNPSGAVGPKRAVERFIAHWRNLDGSIAELRRSLRVFQLDRVIPPRGAPGCMRQATLDDEPLIERWNKEFGHEIGELGPGRTGVRPRIETGQMHLWLDPDPVSMAAWAGPTPNGIRVNAVYTPPEHRNHGYASACVAALSQKLLDEGRRFCFLYTDLANPTSNSIYQKMGYRAVCDWVDYKL